MFDKIYGHAPAASALLFNLRFRCTCVRPDLCLTPPDCLARQIVERSGSEPYVLATLDNVVDEDPHYTTLGHGDNRSVFMPFLGGQTPLRLLMRWLHQIESSQHKSQPTCSSHAAART